MIIIKNKKKYYFNFIKISSLILIAFIIVEIFSSFSIIALLLFLFIEIILISSRFTQSVSIDTSFVVIYYYHFLIKKQLVFPRKDVEIKEIRIASFRSPAYNVINIIKNRKQVYQIDSRDGFDKDDLKMIMDFVNSN